MISTNANVESWKSNVPESWSIIPLKFITSYNDEKLSELSDPDLIFDYIDIGSVSYENGIETVQRCCFKDAPSRARRVVRENDVILSTVRTYLKAGAIIPEHDRLMIVSTGFITIRAKETILSQYLKYLILSHGFVSEVECRSYGSNYPAINPVEIENITVPLPDIKSQESITSFLDARCSSIDSAISKHQQLIEKLEEYRKAVITQAVTNGLNPNVEMKDSGDSIIPIVPSHWLWTRVKFTVNVVRGGSPRPIEQYIIGEKEDGYNWIKIGDATGGGKFIIATKQRIKPDGLNKTRLVHAGTLLLTNSMSFGHPYFLQIDGCIHDGWLAFSDYKGVLPAFLYYYLMSETTAHQFTTTADGSVVQNLNIDKVRNSHIALPPIVEQKAIVQYLDTVDGKINTAIQHHNQIIEKLQEYKQSLIYNAVTGKIDCTTEA